MPAELLPITPAYVIVGAYRLIHDSSIWKPIWVKCQRAIKRGLLVATIWSMISYPMSRVYVGYFVKKAQLFSTPGYEHESRWLGINVVTYATFMLVLGQASSILEFLLSRELRTARGDAYEVTVKSRKKDASFWQPYTEEWLEPPYESAHRSAEKQKFYRTLTSPFIRMILLKVFLMPLNFIPFLGLLISAYLRSLTMARILHQPYFLAKRMSPEQIELFIVERNVEYRSFGFTAALLERLPVLGLIFSISNRIGAAMWAHDLEKQQHAFASGDMKRTRIYQSKTAQIPPSDIPDSVGSFPTKKAPIVTDESIRKAAEGPIIEVPGGEGIAVQGTPMVQRTKPPLPPRKVQ